MCVHVKQYLSVADINSNSRKFTPLQIHHVYARVWV